MGIQQIFDGTSIYTIDSLNEEVIIQDESSFDNPLNPLDIFEFHKEGYMLQWDIAQRVLGRDIRYVKLIPTGKLYVIFRGTMGGLASEGLF